MYIAAGATLLVALTHALITTSLVLGDEAYPWAAGINERSGGAVLNLVGSGGYAKRRGLSP
jgi:hypothetical protein